MSDYDQHLADMAASKREQLRTEYQNSLDAYRNATHLPDDVRDAKIAEFERKLDAL